MKQDLQCAVVLIVFMALIPCLVFAGVKEKRDEGFTVGVYMNNEGVVEKYSVDEYTTFAVLAQMPADFDEEALKAQAVLARTYILSRYEAERDSPTPALHGALISDDERIYQSFFTEEKAKAFYGDEYASALKKVSRAVKEAPEILTYKGEPVTVAFHSASSGFTESALNAWGQDIPYLQAVESSSDAELNGIESKLTVSCDDFRDTISEQLGITLTGSPESWLDTEANERGYVTSVKLCGSDVNVQRFIMAAGIASPCFSFETNSNTLIFTSRGYGHLVGMSQYGANSMAEKGCGYHEILAHYYRNCKTEK